MKRIDLDKNVEIITVLSYDSEHCITDMSYNNPDHSLVLENRKKVCELLHTDLQHCVAPNQCHTVNFKEVTLKDGGRGMYSKEDAMKETDALITSDKNLWLWSFHADCCPVMICAKDKHFIASIHSGWKGTIQEISRHVIEHLIQLHHCDPKQMLAFIGPTIEKNHFEAMDDIIAQVKKMSFDTHAFYTQKDETHYLLDHKGLIQKTLLISGLLEENILISDVDTYENDDYFSYRKSKTASRNVTMIKMK